MTKNPKPKFNPAEFRPAFTFRESLSMCQFEFPKAPIPLIYRVVSEIQRALTKARSTAYVEVKNRRIRGDLPN